jgi:hypothetical protein
VAMLLANTVALAEAAANAPQQRVAELERNG